MLDPNQFIGSGTTLQAKINTYWNDVKTVITSAPLSRTASGSLAFDQQRTVMCYDVSTTCELNSLGYILRERVTSSGTRELMLKYRSIDRYISVSKNINGNQSGAVCPRLYPAR